MSVADSLYNRAFWAVYHRIQERGEKNLEFSEVDQLVLEWSKMEFDDMVKESEKHL